jgi:hypothetical protein
MLLVAGLACACVDGTAPVKKCYALVEAETTTTLELDEQAGPLAKITIHEHKAGVAVAEPTPLLGRVEGGSFRTSTGLVIAFDERTMTWPQDSLLPGAVFQRVPCR